MLNLRIGILLLIALIMLTLAALGGCGPTVETIVTEEEHDRSGWAIYDTTALIVSGGDMIDPGFGRLAPGANDPGFGRPSPWWSLDGKLQIIRDSTHWHDSTIYLWRYKFRDSLRIRDSVRWHDRFTEKDTTVQVLPNKTLYERAAIWLFPGACIVCVVLAGIIVYVIKSRK